jgi:hypothetical protein
MNRLSFTVFCLVLCLLAVNYSGAAAEPPSPPKGLRPEICQSEWLEPGKASTIVASKMRLNEGLGNSKEDALIKKSNLEQIRRLIDCLLKEIK